MPKTPLDAVGLEGESNLFPAMLIASDVSTTSAPLRTEQGPLSVMSIDRAAKRKVIQTGTLIRYLYHQSYLHHEPRPGSDCR